ncbi:hypothetical protein BGW80DRAFT_1276659 [Lactifluus volemus]|nr:hypothetical protein BGW80DRAFT_1276659 [Lactifluus volemus]
MPFSRSMLFIFAPILPFPLTYRTGATNNIDTLPVLSLSSFFFRTLSSSCLSDIFTHLSKLCDKESRLVTHFLMPSVSFLRIPRSLRLRPIVPPG